MYKEYTKIDIGFAAENELKRDCLPANRTAVRLLHEVQVYKDHC